MTYVRKYWNKKPFLLCVKRGEVNPWILFTTYARECSIISLFYRTAISGITVQREATDRRRPEKERQRVKEEEIRFFFFGLFPCGMICRYVRCTRWSFQFFSYFIFVIFRPQWSRKQLWWSDLVSMRLGNIVARFCFFFLCIPKA